MHSKSPNAGNNLNNKAAWISINILNLSNDDVATVIGH